MNAIFDVAAYEAAYGPIETVNCDLQWKRHVTRQRKQRKRHQKIRQRRVLGTKMTILGGFISLFCSSFPLLSLVVLLLVGFGVPMMILE